MYQSLITAVQELCQHTRGAKRVVKSAYKLQTKHKYSRGFDSRRAKYSATLATTAFPSQGSVAFHGILALQAQLAWG